MTADVSQKCKPLNLVFTAACLLALLPGCADSLLVGACADGFEASGSRCVPVGADGGADSGSGDAAVDAASRDGSISDGALDGGTNDGGAPTDAGVGDSAAADAAPTDAATVDAGMMDAAPPCGVGETLCPGSMCINLMGTDPDNCGACGRSCTSGICVGGVCDEDISGHVVLIGHDYETSRSGQNQVAGNSVFLAAGAPVRTVVFEGTATAESMTGVDAAIDQVAGSTGRAWTRIPTLAAAVPAALTTADAFIIYPQPGSTDAALNQLGMDWETGLSNFLNGGGVIVLFDAPSAMNIGTWQILDAAMQFDGTAITDVSLDQVMVVRSGDAVAIDVPLNYRGETSTVWFDTTDPDVVIRHTDGPVVIHRVIPP